VREGAMDKFKAYTHYGDWKGTVAADEAHPESVHELLKKMGLIRKDEFLLSVSVSRVDGSVLVSAFVLEGMGELGQVEEYLESHMGPIPVREARFEMTTAEFFELFKDFNLVLTWQDLKLEGRECSVKEQEPINAQN
jgi:hypothetical protein